MGIKERFNNFLVNEGYKCDPDIQDIAHSQFKPIEVQYMGNSAWIGESDGKVWEVRKLDKKICTINHIFTFVEAPKNEVKEIVAEYTVT